VEITRRDGTVLRFVESETDLSVGGNTYSALAGLTIGSITYGLDSVSSGVDIAFGSTEDSPISQDDIRDGAYDAAEVEIREVDREFPAYGNVQIFWGRVQQVQRKLEGGSLLEARGILSQSYQIIVERYSPMCIWYFCDDRCQFPEASVTFTGTITAIPDGYTLTVSGAAAGRPDDVFKDGVLSVTSGLREGLRVEMRGNTGGTIRTFLSHPRGLQIGDTISALQGCQKRFVDCQAYGNTLRFGGQHKAGSPAEANSISYIEWGG
jgi:uncharacterized phage protein (TIGR02218 family)